MVSIMLLLVGRQPLARAVEDRGAALEAQRLPGGLRRAGLGEQLLDALGRRGGDLAQRRACCRVLDGDRVRAGLSGARSVGCLPGGQALQTTPEHDVWLDCSVMSATDLTAIDLFDPSLARGRPAARALRSRLRGEFRSARTRSPSTTTTTRSGRSSSTPTSTRSAATRRPSRPTRAASSSQPDQVMPLDLTAQRAALQGSAGAHQVPQRSCKKVFTPRIVAGLERRRSARA